ncbi:MAG: universal stress protein [Thermodesulfovibrio sp.]|uniref:universal stress protein n=1 Tax=unclassified Thermodesulfovibrio TaxID=2645936 RepID=UPI00083A6D33|nr:MULTISPECIES: universal stress protein [unclassified Thermodesulfovibrio]MDI1472347.1 universal stress protein [Thermodesulfovibrio sp. 1176]MDI6714212.1 universal stress protein [Thermodesulfovibrio sp.]ODA43768.1 Universal stress protein [Thermodesulfovibrio sp. N1]
MIRKILLCTDGEEHSKKAEQYAICLAEKFESTIVCLFVVNPFLKKFTNEIYAINRNECRAHLDRAIQTEGKIALDNFQRLAQERQINTISKMRYGDPAEEILKEIKENSYDLIIMGAKLLKGWKMKFESFNLPEKIFKSSPIPMFFVR